MLPNGEAVVWRPRSVKMDSLVKRPDQWFVDRQMAIFRLAIECPQVLKASGCLLGLSLLPNLDNVKKGLKWDVDEINEAPVQYGSKGLTSYGARMVRNSAYLLESEFGKHRCIFATCTVPALPLNKLRMLHEEWHHVVNIYRLHLRRILKRNKLPCELVTVTEVQGKRYERTGIPVLHIHSVFVGVTGVGKFAVSTEVHDYIWKCAIRSVIGDFPLRVDSACNLQRVRKSASGYMAKYITKGCTAVKAIASGEHANWLPKQWWNCTRSLVARVKEQTRTIDDLAEFLVQRVSLSDENVWVWHRFVEVEVTENYKITIATYGQLAPALRDEIHETFK